MRDFLAGVVAIALLVAAASLATTLQRYKRRRQRELDSERALGRTIVAEIPGADDLVLFSEDEKRFYYGDRSIDKDSIVAVRLLINRAPIASYVVADHRLQRRPGSPSPSSRSDVSSASTGSVADVEESGIARDRWDVAVDTVTGTAVIACGAIRERVSQELARSVFSAIRLDLERRDAR